MSSERLVLERTLGELERLPAEPTDVKIRPLTGDDVPALATLMVAAYRGSVDDEGETETEAREEVANTFAGKYGLYLPYSSLGLWRDDALASAVVSTLFDGVPLFAFCMTAPRFKRMGYCRFLMMQSQRAMFEQGWALARLYVTATNLPALSLYRQIGFASTGGLNGD